MPGSGSQSRAWNQCPEPYLEPRPGHFGKESLTNLFQGGVPGTAIKKKKKTLPRRGSRHGFQARLMAQASGTGSWHKVHGRRCDAKHNCRRAPHHLQPYNAIRSNIISTYSCVASTKLMRHVLALHCFEIHSLQCMSKQTMFTGFA